MKVIVSDLPVKSEDCIFAEYIGMTSKYKCMFQSGMYSRCKLDCGEACPYLKKEPEKTSVSVEQEIRELLDTLVHSEAIRSKAVAPEVVFSGVHSYLVHGYDHQVIVDFNKMARALYNAGYRKGEKL